MVGQAFDSFSEIIARGKTMKRRKLTLPGLRLVVLFILLASVVLSSVTQAQDSAGVPVFEISQTGSTIQFAVKASIAIAGTFDNWNATLIFQSPDVTTADLDVEIQAASVDRAVASRTASLRAQTSLTLRTIR
jgi:polyisoprenoid-binding protein YceI